MSRASHRLRITVVVALGVLACVAAAGTGAANQPNALQLSEIAGYTFPERAYRLSLGQDTELRPELVTVLENGAAVNDVSLSLPGTQGAPPVGVVLLIDASNSMEGKPIVRAMAAARTLADRLPPGVPLAAILFNNKTVTRLEFTDDHDEMQSGLTRVPPLAYGTRINDAVASAQGLLTDAGVRVGSIVLLSDGNDVGSVIPTDEALSAVKQAKTRIFSVGLRSSQFDPETLRGLSSASNGTFAEATSADDLKGIYATIGDTISREYVVRYESFAPPASNVYVTVRVAGARSPVTARYVSPGLPESVVVEPSLWDRIVQSPFTAAFVALLIAGLIGLGTYLLVRRRDRSLERRMASFVTLPPDEQSRLRQEDVRRRLERQDELHEKTFSYREFHWFKRLEEGVEVGRIPMSAGAIVAWTAVASVGVVVVAGALFSSAWVLLLAVVPPLISWNLVNRRMRSIRREFAEQLPETLDVVSSALRAGHSLSSALNVAVSDAPEPSRTELGRAVADDQLGVPLDEALRLVSHRMDNRDLMQMALVAKLQREVGTNASEVLDQVASNVRHQVDLRRQIKSLTAQGRMSRWIVSILPFVLFGALFAINRDYLKPLWDTTGGTIAMIGALIMILAGSYVIKRIIEFDV